MNNEHAAAVDVTHLLWKLEEQLDAAFATSGELAAALPRARTAARLPAIAGQQAFELVSQAMMAIGAARGHTVQGHRVLEKVGRTIGYDADYGDTRPKPDFMPGGSAVASASAKTGADTGHLRVAA